MTIEHEPLAACIRTQTEHEQKIKVLEEDMNNNSEWRKGVDKKLEDIQTTLTKFKTSFFVYGKVFGIGIAFLNVLLVIISLLLAFKELLGK